MKSYLMNFALVLICGLFFSSAAYRQSTNQVVGDLKVIIIRHAEKPLKGDNLTCQGLNRSLQLPAILFAKFGIPGYTYVPSFGLDKSTKHSRMFQTVIPFAVKYNLTINSKFNEKDSTGVAADIRDKEGTVLMVWEHRTIAAIVRALGVRDFDLTWDDNDYDSIWIITFTKGIATISNDKEGLVPASGCSY